MEKTDDEDDIQEESGKETLKASVESNSYSSGIQDYILTGLNRMG